MIPGTFLQTRDGVQAFIPDPLPPKVQWKPQVQQIVEKATYLLGQVEMCRTLLPNASLLIYSSLSKEALASSTIEGTFSTPEELLLYQATKKMENESAAEVANYSTALEWGCEQLNHLPLSNRIILGLHEILLQNVRGALWAGPFKKSQNYIISGGASINDAVFIPPPPDTTQQLISGLEIYINSDNHDSKIVQVGLAHYQFETIHPFADGNGRVGRLLILLHLIQLKLISAPLIYPSVYFERTRNQYYDCLQNVRKNSDWNGWIEYFSQGIAEQCDSTIKFTKLILELRHNLAADMKTVSRKATLTAVLDVFFENPVRTIAQISQSSHLSVHSVIAVLQFLETSGIVSEITGMRKKRVYACMPILNAIFNGNEIKINFGK